MPAWCAACRPSSTSTINATASCGVQRPCWARCSASVLPGTYSKTMYGCRPCTSASNTGTMYGWARRPTWRASRSHCSSTDGSWSCIGRMSLMATSRCNRGSSASQTVAWAPRPRSFFSSNRPREVGGFSLAPNAQRLAVESGAKSVIAAVAKQGAARRGALVSHILCLCHTPQSSDSPAPITLSPHSCPHDHHAPSVPARFSLVAAVGQGPADGRLRRTAPYARDFLVPAVAAVAARRHGAGGSGHRPLAPPCNGGDGFITGRVLRQLGGAACWLPQRDAEPGRVPRARPRAVHRRADHLAKPVGTVLLSAGIHR
ncbi:hypothetical protein D3C72_1461770 [compost metagenome]